MFPPWFLEIAVYGGLALVTTSALALAGLWLRDFRHRRLW